MKYYGISLSLEWKNGGGGEGADSQSGPGFLFISIS
ncbi:hypothetical protein ROG8370_02703 [Roseovarius gaetbuli]|uniref:Uncharacterized protein n=1 Tax=Roseovarius gaetbuli TaxID=1356575 RepID=A0A1X6ZTA3_9RHOB|nr:hypothetical protein ROG8370_02703 [Roseovarius gaetbuli]